MASRKLNKRYIASLAFAAGMILWIGWLLRPAPHSSEVQPQETQSELLRLQKRAQRRSLEDVTAFFVDAAAEVQRYVMRLEPLGQSVVIWTPRSVVTSSIESIFPRSLNLSFAEVSLGAAETDVTGPHLAVTTLTPVDPTELAAPARSSIALHTPGSWLLAVWRLNRGPHAFLQGLFVESRPTTCGESSYVEILSSMNLYPSMIGGGVFDLEHNLAALITRCDGRVTMLSAESVAAVLDNLDSFDTTLLARYGMRLGELSVAEKRHFQALGGIIVKETWTGYAADRAGLLPGDILVELEGRPVKTSDDVMQFALPVAREVFELRVLRQGKRVDIHLGARPLTAKESQGASAAGLVWGKPEEGFPVEAVLAETPAAEASIQPGDLVVRVNQRQPRSLDELRRELAAAGGGAAHLVLQRGDRRWGVLL